MISANNANRVDEIGADIAVDCLFVCGLDAFPAGNVRYECIVDWHAKNSFRHACVLAFASACVDWRSLLAPGNLFLDERTPAA